MIIYIKKLNNKFFSLLKNIFIFLLLIRIIIFAIKNFYYLLYEKYFNFQKKNKKIKLLSNLIFLAICSASLTIYLLSSSNHIHKSDSKQNEKQYKKEEYDLYKHVLTNQNVSKYEVTCKNQSEQNYNNKIFSKTISDKYKLFENFFVFDLTSIANYNQSINIIDLNYENHTQKNDNPKMIKFLNKLKFCTITEYRKKFQSKSVFNDSILNLASLFDSEVNSFDPKFNSINSNRILKTGGYFKPPICLQEYLYYYSNETVLINLKHSFDYFNYKLKNSQNKYHIVREILTYLAKYSYDIIKNQFKSSSKRLAIKKFINSKENDLTFIVIPYLNRKDNLIDLMYNLHSFLQKQFLHYKILLVEQFNIKDPFNKGRLYNSAFNYLLDNYYVEDLNHDLELESKLRVNCLIFHDIDLIPESDYNIYGCNNDYSPLYFRNKPRHLSLSIRENNLTLTDVNYFELNGTKLYKSNLYELLVGGVLCIKPSSYKHINGFSNEYWNWGAEDDDLAIRMIVKDVCITRPNSSYALYKMSEHKKSTRNPVRAKLLFSTIKRMKNDGLSNFFRLKLKIVDEKQSLLFTRIRVNVSEQPWNYYQKINSTEIYNPFNVKLD